MPVLDAMLEYAIAHPVLVAVGVAMDIAFYAWLWRRMTRRTR